jgi:hypothetical protein
MNITLNPTQVEALDLYRQFHNITSSHSDLACEILTAYLTKALNDIELGVNNTPMPTPSSLHS